jgi:hypothetical protein
MPYKNVSNKSFGILWGLYCTLYTSFLKLSLKLFCDGVIGTCSTFSSATPGKQIFYCLSYALPLFILVFTHVCQHFTPLFFSFLPAQNLGTENEENLQLVK